MIYTSLLISIGDVIYMFVLQVIGIVIFVYGLLSLIQDITNEITYKRISHNMKIVMFAKGLEKNLEQFMIELYQMKKVNAYRQLVIIDLEEEDDISKIKTRLFNNEINAQVYNKENGKGYIKNLLQNENISFL